MPAYRCMILQGEKTIEAENEEEALEKLLEHYANNPTDVDYSVQDDITDRIVIEKKD